MRHFTMPKHKYIYIYICSIIRDNVMYECFHVLDIHKQDTNIKRNCDTLTQENDKKTYYYILLSFYWIMCHNYDLYLCFIYIYIYI